MAYDPNANGDRASYARHNGNRRPGMAYPPAQADAPSLEDLIAGLLPQQLGPQQPSPIGDTNFIQSLMQGAGQPVGDTNYIQSLMKGAGPKLSAGVPATPFPEADRDASAMQRRLQGGKQLGPEQPVEDPTLTAINELMKFAGAVPEMGDISGNLEGIMSEAASAAGAPFRAQIQTTRNQNQRAKADTKDSSQAIRKMYRSLSRSNKRAAGRESDQATETAQQITDMGAQSAETLAAENQARLDQSAAQSAALGSGDLAATLSSEINANTSDAANNLTQQAQNSAEVVAERGDTERQFLNRSAGNARLVGTNRAADLFGDLQNYLQGNRDKIGELSGQRAAAVGAAQQSAAASASDAAAQQYEMQYGAHQDQLQNQMALLGMKTDLQQQDFTNNMGQEQFGLDKAKFGLSQEQFGLDQLMAQLGNQQDVELIPGFPNELISELPDEERSKLLMGLLKKLGQ